MRTIGETGTRDMSEDSPCEDIVGRQPLSTKERGLQRHQSDGISVLTFQPSKLRENKFLLFKILSLYFVMVALANSHRFWYQEGGAAVTNT